MTLYEAVKLHRELWRWLAETGAADKSRWSGWEKQGRVFLYCFMCEYVKEIYNGIICVMCPLKWDIDGKKSAALFCGNGIFGKWRNAETTAARKKYAAIIAELPLKEEYQEQYDKEALDEKQRKVQG